MQVALKNSTFYYPFGSLKPSRNASTSNYRFGFGGHEKDDDVKSVAGSHLSFGDYGYDTRLGRRWNIDPKYNKIPGISPYSYALNNPIILKDPDGKLPIIPFLLKAGVAGAADALLQASMIFLTNDDVETFGQALTKIDKSDVALSILEGLIPWRVPGGKLGEAALVGSSDALMGIGESAINGEEITTEQIGRDFLVGTLSQLAGDQVSDILSSKTARNKLKNLLGDRADELEIFRVFGGDAKVDGFSFTPDNPANTPNFRDVAGLPSGGTSGLTNTAEFTLQGTVKPKNIIKTRGALPLDGNKGGLTEFIINPKNVNNKEVSKNAVPF
jgi:RHS repeat-associated protein